MDRVNEDRWPSGKWQVVRTRLPLHGGEGEQVLEFTDFRDRGQALALFDRWRADPAVASGEQRIKVLELDR
ncbi:hypothetical protein [Longispora albida]|uniref:hypothetical protein n=1 Tax=Longispora albida TaxID=203523 RepID=UPI0012F8F28E|nr:hypothetical protein [Longispora albida]